MDEIARNEVEVRCQRCAEKHPDRSPTLLATVRGGFEILVPIRTSAHRAQRQGHAVRTGLWWKKPDEDGPFLLFHCRRCKMDARIPRVALQRASSYSGIARLLLGPTSLKASQGGVSVPGARRRA